MEFQVGDIIVFNIKNFTECTMLILEIPKQLDFGYKCLVLELDTGETKYFNFYPIDRLYIKKVG